MDQINIYSGISRELVLNIYEFALRLRKNEKLGQTSITKKIRDKFKISISESTVSGWIYNGNVPYLQEKTQFKSKPVPPKKILYVLYIDKSLSASNIAKKFNVSPIIVINWLKKYGLRVRTHTESMNTQRIKEKLADLRFKRPSKPYKTLTSEKAYLLSVLAGDGCIDNKCIKLEIRRDEEFIREFAHCLESVYGIKYNYKYIKKKNTFLLNLSSMLISEDLLRYGDFRTMTWEVPIEIENSSNQNIISSYLRGLFDSEGCISGYCISLTSCSYKGLLGLSSLLKKLNIQSKVKPAKYSVLYISRKKNLALFRDLIGFTIKRKMNKLNNVYRLGW